MEFLKFKRVEIRKPKCDPHPEKSSTNNHEWRKGLFIIFEDYNGQEFDWMPKWDEIATIEESRVNIDDLNKILAAKQECVSIPNKVIYE
jgi:hypothetical protein